MNERRYKQGKDKQRLERNNGGIGGEEEETESWKNKENRQKKK